MSYHISNLRWDSQTEWDDESWAEFVDAAPTSASATPN